MKLLGTILVFFIALILDILMMVYLFNDAFKRVKVNK